jgi:hypothetical protein
MFKQITFIFLLLTLVLAACQSAGTTTATGEAFGTTPVPTEEVAPTAITPQASEATADSSGEASTAQCTVVSSLTGSEESPYPPVSDEDWITGSATAEVTIIEYSDFQ